MKDYDKALDKVNDVKTDKAFLKRLSKWIIELSGNVNVAQRLNVIALAQLKDGKN